MDRKQQAALLEIYANVPEGWRIEITPEPGFDPSAFAGYNIVHEAPEGEEDDVESGEYVVTFEKKPGWESFMKFVELVFNCFASEVYDGGAGLIDDCLEVLM